MPNEVGMQETRSDAPSADDSLFGEAAALLSAASVEGEDSTDRTEQDGQGSDDAGEQDAKTEAAEDDQGADEAGEETASDDLRVVVSIKGGRATIGVQRPSADPHIETFDADDLTGLAQELVSVTERARAKWEETPKHPAYARPVPVKSRNRRGQASTQAEATTDE